MPPLNGERQRSRAPSGSERLRTTTALQSEQQGLFAFFDRAQPITGLAWLAGKLKVIPDVKSPKVVYQAKGQQGEVYTRAWLKRDLQDTNTISLLTDVVHIDTDGMHHLVPDSEQVQVSVTRDGEMSADPLDLLSRETTLTFINESQDTAALVGREVEQARFSGPHYMSP